MEANIVDTLLLNTIMKDWCYLHCYYYRRKEVYLRIVPGSITNAFCFLFIMDFIKLLENVLLMEMLLAFVLLLLNMRFSLAHSLSMKSSHDSSCAHVVECLPIFCINVIHVHTLEFRRLEVTMDADRFLMF